MATFLPLEQNGERGLDQQLAFRERVASVFRCDLGDLVTAGFDNINPFLIKVYQPIDSFNQGNQAEKIANMSEVQIAQAVAAANEVRDYYKEGGKVMLFNMQALLDAYGNYGQITPENLQAFLKFVGDARVEEEASDKSDYDV